MTPLRCLLIIVALLGSLGAACGRSADEDKRATEQKAAEVREDVDDKSAEVREDVADAVDEGREKLDETGAGARDTAANAKDEAEHKLRAANRDLRTGDTDLRTWGKQKIADLDEDIDEAKREAHGATGKARAKFETGIEDVEVQRDAIARKVNESTAVTDEKIEKIKDSVDKQVDTLKDRVDQLSKDL
jgi:ElaB/YqjD/DUF883 family membrane-anchored ribosome-binding protein